MKILLKEDVDNLGLAGEVHNVADGYGRNYLLPQGMAIKATPKTLKQAEAWRRKAETRRAEIRAEYEELSRRLSEVKLTFIAKAGETGRLYGSVTTSQITDKLNAHLGTDIDRRKVGIEPLRQLGDHQVVVRLSGDFQPHITVTIDPEDEPAAPAPVAEEPVAEAAVAEEPVAEAAATAATAAEIADAA